MSLNMKQAGLIKDAFVGLVAKDADAAVEFLVGAGNSPEDAKAEIDSILAGIRHAEKKDMLKDFLADLKLAFTDAIPDISIDPDIARVKVEAIYTVDEETGEASWDVPDPRLWLKGEERAMSTRRTSSGGGKSKIPCPEGITNWKAYASETYPDMILEGRSAPRELERVKDEVYLAAKEAASQG